MGTANLPWRCACKEAWELWLEASEWNKCVLWTSKKIEKESKKEMNCTCINKGECDNVITQTCREQYMCGKCIVWKRYVDNKVSDKITLGTSA